MVAIKKAKNQRYIPKLKKGKKMTQLLTISCAMLAGLLVSRITKLLKLPNVSAFLIAGLLIGPFCIGRLGITGIGFHSLHDVETYKIITDVALGFIAFSIGNEFRLSHLRETGKVATVIGIFQAVVTTLLVDAVLIGLHLLFPKMISLPAAIVLGAIASATAPAATLMVVRQYKAKGKLTELLLPIVALDDAVGLAIFAISFGIARALGSGKVSVLSVVVEPIVEIVISLALGFIMGTLLTAIEKHFKSNSRRLALSVAFVIATVGLSLISFEVSGIECRFSSLLTCMMLGTVFCNFCDFSPEIMDKTDGWSAPLLVLFFVISGAELDLSVITKPVVLVVGLIYIASRSIGKIFGAYSSAAAMKCEKNIKNYLGFTLLPQAGVALGMCLTASVLPDGVLIRNVVLFAVLIYELVGPMITKISLMKAGDITGEATNARAVKPEKVSKHAHR